MRNHCWRLSTSFCAFSAERTRSILPEPMIGNGDDGRRITQAYTTCSMVSAPISYATRCNSSRSG